MSTEWFKVGNVEEVASPALLVYPERVRENIRRMVQIAGGPDRLRPHIKTTKTPEVVRMLMDAGITKVKCATIAEAEIAARCGVPDVLLAYQPVGPNILRFMHLVQSWPRTLFSTIADNPDTLRALSAVAAPSGRSVEVLLDVDCGQHRTGIVPGLGAIELYHFLNALPGLKAGGLHVYDGHIHDSDPSARAARCESDFAPVRAFWTELLGAQLPVPRVVAGGTPTFPMHARRGDVELSPGTCVYWDRGYGLKFPDLDFLVAALLLTRIVSKPGPDRLCLDLGHKAVASEMPHPRVYFPELHEARPVAHNEEHLVLETEQAAEWPVGSALCGIPVHICPTVNLHGEAVVIENGRAGGTWKIEGRERRITI